jgi:hypothetical protein
MCIFVDNMTEFIIELATQEHLRYAEQICAEMESSAKVRGTGIARRSAEYIRQKMLEGKAIIAFSNDKQWAGFCYIETWQSGEYVANSGLIVAPPYRKLGLARLIKEKIFELSRSKYPGSKIFGLTTGLAVMKINSELGYEPVTYSELTHDAAFWNGCKSCVNYPILTSKEFKNCLCTAMLYQQKDETQNQQSSETKTKKTRKLSLMSGLIRLKKIKQSVVTQIKTTLL